jgi:hypothetical protein
MWKIWASVGLIVVCIIGIILASNMLADSNTRFFVIMPLYFISILIAMYGGSVLADIDNNEKKEKTDGSN